MFEWSYHHAEEGMWRGRTRRRRRQETSTRLWQGRTKDKGRRGGRHLPDCPRGETSGSEYWL
ncbi:hypothetical protein WUBG_13630, partial [Wuchereria bancrofti]